MKRPSRGVWRWGIGLGIGLPFTALLSVAGFAWYYGFSLGSGLVHSIEFHRTVESNPQLLDFAGQRVTWMGDIENRDLSESSGLAASNLLDDVLWSVNDSGGRAEIYAMATNGEHLGAWLVDMPKPTDWEAMDSFVLDGVAYLLIADVGDNLRWRPELSFVVVREPDLTSTDILPVAWQLSYRYPDGYRDCEAVAVDAENSEVLLLSKRRQPNEMFSVPLKSATNATVTATKLVELSDLPRPTELDSRMDPDNWEYVHMPSGMDLAGNRLLLTTYKDAFLYRRDALEQAPLRIRLPSLGQREAIAFARGRDDVAYITKERKEGIAIADIFMIELPASGQTLGAVSLSEQ